MGKLISTTPALYSLSVRVDRECIQLINELCDGGKHSRSELVGLCIRTYYSLSKCYKDVPPPAFRKKMAMLLELQDLALKVDATIQELVTLAD